MSATRIRVKISGRSVLVALGAVAVLVAWILAFYLPQTHKLTALNTQRATLQSTVTTDEAHLERVKTEAQHVTQIRAMYNEFEGYVPSTESLYPYIHTISSAAKATGVTITSLSPGTLSTATGTAYSAIPITASVRGTYDHLLAFIKRLYDLPRLTDVNSFSISGGGPRTSRSTVLSATFELAIFTSQRPSGGT